MYAADLKYVTGTDQLHITIFQKLVIDENVKPKYLYSFFLCHIVGQNLTTVKIVCRFCVIC